MNILTLLFNLKFIFQLFLFLIIFIKINSLNDCNNKNEKEATLCLEPMLSFANAVQERQNIAQNKDGKLKNHFLLPEGSQVFRQLCSLYKNFKVEYFK
jgi:hypothetical protein